MYSSDPDVLYAEPDYIGHFLGEPNDYFFDEQRGMHDTGGGIRGPSAWDLWTGDPEFLIAVLDTGARLDHPDLTSNIWCNPKECPGIMATYGWCDFNECSALGDVNNDGCPGECDVDDDGDGLVDEDSEGREPGDQGYTNDLVEDDDENGYPNDASGWNFNPGGRNPWDVRSDTYHGTHMSGIIGAVGNNSVGVTGVNWQCKIVVVKIDQPNYPGVIQVSDAIEALDYVIANKIKVSNNSYGCPGTFSQSHYDKILATQDVGHIFVAAAGNFGADNDDPEGEHTGYPASYDLDNIISVAATDEDDELASFSNYGEETVDLGAPGVAILSTMSDDWVYPPWDYVALSGTSMATAHVTGVVALLWSLNPHWSWQTVKDRVLQTARPVPALAGITVTGGVVNAYAAINDCNQNGVPDPQDISAGTSADCNHNHLPDECDIASGRSQDCGPNGIPDECEVQRACCRPDPYHDCIVTTQQCCADLGGIFEAGQKTCPPSPPCPEFPYLRAP